MYDGNGIGKRLGERVFWGRSEDSLDDAIRAAVNAMPTDLVEQRQAEQNGNGDGVDQGEDDVQPRGARFVVTSITVEVVGDPNVGAYSVTVS